MTKLISQMFKNGKHKSNYKATTLQLFRNKEIYNYITNSRILEEDYDY